MFNKLANKISYIYFNFLLNYIPPKYQGFTDWTRIIFWDFPKFVLIPIVKNFNLITIKRNRHKQKLYISYVPTTEGIGGQLCRYCAAIILADQLSLTYIHHDFGPDFLSPNVNWQKFLGFGFGSKNFKTVSNQKNIRLCILPRFDLRYLKRLQLLLIKSIVAVNSAVGDDILFLVTNYSLYPMNEYANWKPVLQKMRDDYFLARNKNPIKPSINNRKISIAALVRRGDIAEWYKSGNFQGKSRWVKISWYESVLKKLIKMCGKNIVINIFSDAVDPKELSSLRKFPNTHIYLSKKIKNQQFLAFDTMSKADIVINGLSSFSYFASSLSDNIKIIPPTKVRVNYFPEHEGDGWIFANYKGEFNQKQVKMYILNKMKN